MVSNQHTANDMPTTLTLKNIPDEVYEALKSAAAANRRSLNSEAIVQLERSLAVRTRSPDEILARVDALRESLKGQFLPKDIDAFKRKGR